VKQNYVNHKKDKGPVNEKAESKNAVTKEVEAQRSRIEEPKEGQVAFRSINVACGPGDIANGY
jgi:hypothetical protein